MNAPTRRLFFALWPSDDDRSRLLRAASAALAGSDGRGVPAVNLHLTLLFIGSVAQERLAALEEAAGGIVAPRVALTLDAIEHWARPQILCATTRAATPAASALAGALASALLARGFAPDLKPFRAHVTLKRKVTHVSDEREMAAVALRFEQFALLESRTLEEAALYSRLRSWPLYETAASAEKP